MNQISKVFLACACSLSGLTTQAQDQTVWSNDFSNASQPLNTVGRGVCRVNDGVFHSRSAYALFGNPEWKDYTLSFKARAPKDAEQVQNGLHILAGECLGRIHVGDPADGRAFFAAGRSGQASVHITVLTVMW